MRLSRRELLLAGVTGLAGCSRNQPPRTTVPSTTPRGTSTETPEQRTARTTTEPTDRSTGVEQTYVFVDEAQLREQKRKVNAGKQPYRAAYDDLIARANSALNKTERSVADNRNTCNSGTPHRWCNTSDDHDYLAALQMGRWARDCALAHWFTGKDTYANRVVGLLHHWFLQDATYQAPDSDSENAGPLRQHLTIPAFIYAASFVRGHPAWDAYDGSKPWTSETATNAEAAFGDWCAEWVATFPDPDYYMYNNKWAWRIQAKCVAGVYLQDEDITNDAFCMWRGECRTADEGKDKPRPWNHWREEDGKRTAPGHTTSPSKRGFFKRPLSRNDGWVYTYFTYQAMLATAEIARHQGVDLYSYNAPVDDYPGKTLEKSLDWGLYWARNPNDWKWGHGNDGHGDFEAAYASVPYEVAHRAYGDPAYLDVITSTDSRPIRDPYMLGPVTLTHGTG